MSLSYLFRITVVWIVMLTSGCRWVLDLEGYGEADASNCLYTWDQEAYHFTACAIPVPDNEAVLPAGEFYINTSNSNPVIVDAQDTEVLSDLMTVQIVGQGNGLEAVVLMFHTLTVDSGATLRAYSVPGAPSRPLVLAAYHDVIIAGTIDVSSSEDALDPLLVLGAGGNSAACGNSRGASEVAYGGGGGGGFGGQGGGGGRVSGSAATGGVSVGRPTVIRGGCAGGAGQTMDGDSGGTGGNGGGAVILVSREHIVLENGATINAGGAGGAGGSVAFSGGGGGGSGGLIGLDAPIVTIKSNVLLAANGGGGAGGAASDEQWARPGEDGQLAATPAAGGTGQDGANGGNGGALANSNGISPVEVAGPTGTGGGGGGVGFILHRSNATFSEDAQAISPAIDVFIE